MTVIWCDPPSRLNRWLDILAPCVEHPERWGMVREFERPEQAKQAARDLKRPDSRVRIPEGRWEFRWGPIIDAPARWGLWARWLGDDA